ncbi:hypothetical protein [Nocardioides rubriscoriae]|uniref:hypothetical protein n=1 Tax=Nocardioides rubriscoriae TaxID=642762 RepID=UPI0011DF6EF7|nr:hypothetical protein [Nocardioides rubriscoriae]
MTDRLALLLHDEADGLVVPPAPADAVLARGRGLRRRRQAAATGAVAAVVAVVAGIALVVPAGSRPSAPAPAAPTSTSPDVGTAAYGTVYSEDATVHLGDGRTVTVDDQVVEALLPVSAGVVARHGDDLGITDNTTAGRYTLITPDGRARPLDLVTRGPGYAADADQPYLAYTRVGPGGLSVVVHDVVRDREVASIPLPGAQEHSLGHVSLDGDLVYVRTNPSELVVDWRTGQVTSGVRSYDDVVDGLGVTDDRVVDLASGDTVLERDPRQDRTTQLFLSPDGRSAVESSIRTLRSRGTLEMTLHDLTTGASYPLLDRFLFPGWTSDGSVFALRGGELTVCEPTTGACTSTPAPVDPDARVTVVGGR